MSARPRLEILRSEDGIEIYLDGKEVTSHIGHLAKLEAVEDTARAVAEVLGADIGRVDEPSPQPYTYFIAYFWTKGTSNGHGCYWITRDREIITGDDGDAVMRVIAAERGYTAASLTNFICTDGPS